MDRAAVAGAIVGGAALVGLLAPEVAAPAAAKVTSLYGKGFPIGNKLKIAPTGNPDKHNMDETIKRWAARLPHWHYDGAPKRNTLVRTSSKWHRPWETLFRRWF